MRNELSIECTGLAWQPLQPLLAESGFIMFHAFVHILRAKFEHAVNQRGELVGHGGDGFGGAQAGSQASIVSPQSTVAVQQILSRQAQGVSRAVDHVAGAASEHSATADPVVRTEAKPRSEVFVALPPAQVQADRRDEGWGGEHLDAVDAGEVHAAEAVELGV